MMLPTADGVPVRSDSPWTAPVQLLRPARAPDHPHVVAMTLPRKIQDLHDRVLVANLRRCCICKEEEQVQIHHIDGDNANNTWKNLAVLCLRHHGRVTGNEGLGRAYKPSEVRLWKSKWEARCAELDAADSDAEDDETFIDERQVISIAPDEAHEFTFDLSEGDFLAVKVSADRPVHVYGDTRGVADEWEEADPEDEPELLVCEESCIEVQVGLLAEEDGEHVVWLHNDDKKRPVRVKLHFIGWEADDQGGDDEGEDDEHEDSEDADE